MFLSAHLFDRQRGCLLDDQCVVQVEVVPDDCQLCSCPHTLVEEVALLWAHHCCEVDDGNEDPSLAVLSGFFDKSHWGRKFSHRPWRLGWQLAQPRPLLAQTHLAQRPIPLQEQHGGGIFRKGKSICTPRKQIDKLRSENHWINGVFHRSSQTASYLHESVSLLLWSAHSLWAYSIMAKHKTPQQEFYTKIKYLNSGIRQKMWFSDESYNTNSDSKVVSINACIPRNNKSKTNKQEGQTTW